MKKHKLIVSLSILVSLNLTHTISANILEDYVARPDPAYSYKLVKTIPTPAGTAYIIDMTSQTWRSKDEVNRIEWQHWLHIIIPKQVKYSTALLLIDGGSNNGRTPGGPPGELVQIALQTSSVVANIKMIPNEPLRFAGEDFDRSEDSIIAYSWDKYMTTGDKDWPLQLPMTKSAVRAMDTVQKFVAENTDNLKVDNFVVTGGSKRGWTTWLTAVVDKRVKAIAPIVIDLLNTKVSFKHHFNVYGFYAEAVHDYEDMKIFARIDTPESDKLLGFLDPYSYRDRLTMPKYLINSSGDQFFLPDSSRYYFDDLKGIKYLRYVPNTGHGLEDSDAIMSLTMFYQSILENWKLPEFDFAYIRQNTIRVIPKDKPDKVLLWQAENPDTRDFRVDKLGRAWTSSPLKPEDDGTYIARIRKPQKGFAAFFAELIYKSPGKYPYKFTTGIRVIPDTEPFAPKETKK